MGEMSDAEACAAVARAWPGLPVPDAQFLEHVHEQIADAAELAELHVADLFLAHHALRGQPRAVAALRTLLEDLRRPLHRTGAGAQLIDEVLADLPAVLIAPRGGKVVDLDFAVE